jgi:putative FmdB family regulatory protein
MPIYEYECAECCHTFEKRQRFDEQPVAMCPSCGGKCRRVIHANPVIYKAGGFYVTSHRNEVRPEARMTPDREKAFEKTQENVKKMMSDISAGERRLAGTDKK